MEADDIYSWFYIMLIIFKLISMIVISIVYFGVSRDNEVIFASFIMFLIMAGLNALAALSMIPKVGGGFLMPLVFGTILLFILEPWLWAEMPSIDEMTSDDNNSNNSNNSNKFIES